jgi:hypothetical protein
MNKMSTTTTPVNNNVSASPAPAIDMNAVAAAAIAAKTEKPRSILVPIATHTAAAIGGAAIAAGVTYYIMKP